MRAAGPDVYLKYWQDNQERWYARIEDPIYYEEIIEGADNIEIRDQATEICEKELGHNMFVLIMNRIRPPEGF